MIFLFQSHVLANTQRYHCLAERGLYTSDCNTEAYHANPRAQSSDLTLHEDDLDAEFTCDARSCSTLSSCQVRLRVVHRILSLAHASSSMLVVSGLQNV